MSKEPAALIGAISTGVAAILVLLVAFNIPISDGQQAAILGVIAGVGPLAAGLFIRARVFAPATVAELTEAPVTDPKE